MAGTFDDGERDDVVGHYGLVSESVTIDIAEVDGCWMLTFVDRDGWDRFETRSQLTKRRDHSRRVLH